MGPGKRVDAVARPRENYAYELGLYALRASGNVHVVFGGFRNAEGRTIPADSMVCINTDGVRYDGRPFVKRVDVAAGQVQPLWCVVKVPEDAAGTYEGKVSVVADGHGVVIPVQLSVGGTPMSDHGVGTPAKMTRLGWLNSTLAQENTVIAPYTPLEIVGDTVVRLIGAERPAGQARFSGADTDVLHA